LICDGLPVIIDEDLNGRYDQEEIIPPIVQPTINPEYSLSDCAKDTGFNIAMLKSWGKPFIERGRLLYTAHRGPERHLWQSV
jgi:hypothetical protein